MWRKVIRKGVIRAFSGAHPLSLHAVSVGHVRAGEEEPPRSWAPPLLLPGRQQSQRSLSRVHSVFALSLPPNWNMAGENGQEVAGVLHVAERGW